MQLKKCLFYYHIQFLLNERKGWLWVNGLLRISMIQSYQIAIFTALNSWATWACWMNIVSVFLCYFSIWKKVTRNVSSILISHVVKMFIRLITQSFFLLDFSVSRSTVWMMTGNGMTRALGMSLLIIWRFVHCFGKAFICDQHVYYICEHFCLGTLYAWLPLGVYPCTLMLVIRLCVWSEAFTFAF